ncbi:hypothetical protein B5S29_g4183 [[Candida] boidinii]|nr:hypothetical protein B5S29_g4183 [[Candida] boidinii]
MNRRSETVPALEEKSIEYIERNPKSIYTYNNHNNNINNNNNNNNNNKQMNGGSDLLTNPFALSTLTFAIVGWIVAFSGSVASSVDDSVIYPKFSWWGLVYELILIVTIVILYGTGTYTRHRVFITGALAVAFLYTSNSTNNLIYTSTSARNASAAGFILLSIINMLWMFYFGSERSSRAIKYVDKYNTNNKSRMSTLNPNDMRQTQYTRNTRDSYFASDSISLHNKDNTQIPANTYATNQPQGYNNGETQQTDLLDKGNGGDMTNGDDPDYPIVVRGLYDYTANPDDTNELSFKKSEVFRVKDTNGNWWQGKNSKGYIGMCPSNYVEIIS